MDNPVLFALLLTLLAGLSTGIGSAMAFFTKKTNTSFLSMSLGFSAGVMVYVSFVELFPAAQADIAHTFGDRTASWLTVAAFFGGIAFIALIDYLIPNAENPHEIRTVEDVEATKDKIKDKKIYRMGLFTALAIAIHNFPEGIATFMSAISDPKLGIAIAIAIAIHNIPEGIAVAVPLYFATQNRLKSFWLSLLSGLAEPVGAVIAYFLLMPFLVDAPYITGFAFAGVAGIMVFISFDELLPAAREYGKHHHSIYGLVAGMAIMALSLLLTA